MFKKKFKRRIIKQTQIFSGISHPPCWLHLTVEIIMILSLFPSSESSKGVVFLAIHTWSHLYNVNISNRSVTGSVGGKL